MVFFSFPKWIETISEMNSLFICFHCPALQTPSLSLSLCGILVFTTFHPRIILFSYSLSLFPLHLTRGLSRPLVSLAVCLYTLGGISPFVRLYTAERWLTANLKLFLLLMVYNMPLVPLVDLTVKGIIHPKSIVVYFAPFTDTTFWLHS